MAGEEDLLAQIIKQMRAEDPNLTADDRARLDRVEQRMEQKSKEDRDAQMKREEQFAWEREWFAAERESRESASTVEQKSIKDADKQDDKIESEAHTARKETNSKLLGLKDTIIGGILSGATDEEANSQALESISGTSKFFGSLQQALSFGMIKLLASMESEIIENNDLFRQFAKAQGIRFKKEGKADKLKASQDRDNKDFIGPRLPDTDDGERVKTGKKGLFNLFFGGIRTALSGALKFLIGPLLIARFILKPLTLLFGGIFKGVFKVMKGLLGLSVIKGMVSKFSKGNILGKNGIFAWFFGLFGRMFKFIKGFSLLGMVRLFTGPFGLILTLGIGALISSISESMAQGLSGPEIAGKVTKDLLFGLASLVKTLAGFAVDVLKVIGPILGAIITAFRDVIRDTDWASVANSIWSGVKEFMVAIGTSINDFLKENFDVDLSGPVKKMISGISNVFTVIGQMWDKISPFVTSILELTGITSLFSGISDVFKTLMDFDFVGAKNLALQEVENFANWFLSIFTVEFWRKKILSLSGVIRKAFEFIFGLGKDLKPGKPGALKAPKEAPLDEFGISDDAVVIKGPQANGLIQKAAKVFAPTAGIRPELIIADSIGSLGDAAEIGAMSQQKLQDSKEAIQAKTALELKARTAAAAISKAESQVPVVLMGGSAGGDTIVTNQVNNTTARLSSQPLSTGQQNGTFQFAGIA